MSEIAMARRIEIGGGRPLMGAGFEVSSKPMMVPIRSDGGIQIHEGTIHVSPAELQSAERLIQTGASLVEAAAPFADPLLPSTEFGVRVKINTAPESSFAVKVRALVEQPVMDESDIEIAVPAINHPMTDAIRIAPAVVNL